MLRVVMIAGPNGSGKSTLTARLVAAGVDFGAYLNADDLAARMTGHPIEVSAAAQAAVRRARAEALRHGRDHSFETVMSHPSHIEYLSEAKAAGFQVGLYFVATNDPVINEGRVANRVVHGGHDVPRDRIVARYHRCLGNLPEAVAVADVGYLFDNSDADRPFVPIVEVRDGRVHREFAAASSALWWHAVERWL